jgi:hypothetical protein
MDLAISCVVEAAGFTVLNEVAEHCYALDFVGD